MAGVLRTSINNAKLLLGNNLTKVVPFTNSTGSELTIPANRVMGRKTSDNKAALQDKDNTDGSQFPRFVNLNETVVANGQTVDLTLVYGGDIDQSLLVFASGESLASVVTTTYTDSGSDTVAVTHGTIEDLLIANSRLVLRNPTEMYQG